MADIKSIDPNDKLIWYREIVRYSLDTGSAPGLRERRDALNSGATDAAQDDLDVEVIELTMELPNIDAELINDHDDQSLDKWWWWHLGKIHNQTFPAEQLPEALRAVYLDTETT